MDPDRGTQYKAETRAHNYFLSFVISLKSDDFGLS